MSWLNADRNLPSEVTVAVVGDSKVGKTSLIRRFHESKFSWTYKPTIGVAKTQLVIDRSEMSPQVVYYNFIDTNDVFIDETSTLFSRRRETLHSGGARYILVVYDIASHKSFEGAKDWMTLISHMNLTDVTMVLIGNKTDKEKHRQVHRTAGQVFATLNGMVFVETSVSNGYNMNNLFNYLTRI